TCSGLSAGRGRSASRSRRCSRPGTRSRAGNTRSAATARALRPTTTATAAPVRNRAILGARALTLAGIRGCIASAWPDDSPLVPRDGGLLEGNSKWAWLYLAGEIAAFAGYIAALLLLRRSAARLLLVGTVAAAIQLAPLGAPLLISSDAWTYWGYG